MCVCVRVCESSFAKTDYSLDYSTEYVFVSLHYTTFSCINGGNLRRMNK